MDETEQLTCYYCGERFSTDDARYIRDDPICSSCTETHTVVCSQCGELLWGSENAGTEELPLCSECRETYYTLCSRCGSLIRLSNAHYIEDDDDSALCCDCYEHETEGNGCVHAYSYKPEPKFYGDGPRSFGVELEMDQGGKEGYKAKRLLNIGNARQPFIYIKTDGSLDNGLEIVTHPCSLAFHLHETPWKALLEEAVSLGYRGHQTTTAGLHIHVSRAALGHTPAIQEDVIGKILFFVEKHWDELLVFSRRTQAQLNRWAARYGYSDHPRKMMSSAKNSNIGRYACVNLLNHDTIEFRIFRSTLRPDTLLACLELVDAICDAAIGLSEEEMQILSWQAFVMNIDPIEKPELIEYLRMKRLYVNEPVLMTAEEW